MVLAARLPHGWPGSMQWCDTSQICAPTGELPHTQFRKDVGQHMGARGGQQPLVAERTMLYVDIERYRTA